MFAFTHNSCFVWHTMHSHVKAGQWSIASRLRVLRLVFGLHTIHNQQQLDQLSQAVSIMLRYDITHVVYTHKLTYCSRTHTLTCRRLDNLLFKQFHCFGTGSYGLTHILSRERGPFGVLYTNMYASWQYTDTDVDVFNTQTSFIASSLCLCVQLDSRQACDHNTNRKLC